MVDGTIFQQAVLGLNLHCLYSTLIGPASGILFDCMYAFSTLRYQHK